MKKLIALAVAGAVAAPVYAQSNIQLYGVVDANYQYGDIMGNDYSAINSTSGTGGSRIGFRGEEDLGSGLKAVFLLEQGFDISTGQSAEILPADSAASGEDVFTRQAYMGLKGGFGQLTLGRHEAPGYYIYEFDGIGGSGSSALVQVSNFLGLTIQSSARARWSNSALYTGSYQAVSWSAIYSAGNNETDSAGPNGVDNNDDDRFGLSLKYASGPLSATAIYHNVKYNKLNALGDETQKEWALGAAYDFGMVKLVGSYQQGRDVMGQKDRDIDVWQVGAIIPVFGANRVRLSYVHGEIDAKGHDTFDPQAFSVSYLHFLSKRTFLYGGYTQTDYDDMTWGEGAQLALVPSNSGYSPSKKIEDTNLFFVGIRHFF